MLVLRPADVVETTVAWKLAMENVYTPTALILSRQNITDLPAKENRYQEALQAEKGAYIVNEDANADVILLASGSEVSTLVEGAALLRAEGIKVRIVSVPSEGLFRSQSKEYQESILPAGSRIFGLTAGLPVNLEGLVGPNGKVWGLESFGFSAPYKVLDEKLGFTAKNVYNQVKEFISIKMGIVGLCSDHAGFELKEYIKTILDKRGLSYKDFGTYSSDSCDYPDFAHLMGKAVEAGEVYPGIAVCGTGNGISMTLNKHRVSVPPYAGERISRNWHREHNDANVLSMPGRFISKEEAKKIVEIFLDTPLRVVATNVV